MKKILVLLSGGIDSSICLAMAISKVGKENVKTISFDYGQKNIKELEASKEICKYYDVSNKIINISNLFDSENCSLLRCSNNEIPIESYEEQIKKSDTTSTNVPFRNGVLLSICASYALANDMDTIYYGIHTEEGAAFSFYPDCSEEFNLAMNMAIYIGSGKKIKIVAPLSGMFKKDIIKLGVDYKLPFDKTWTCYNNREKSCGKCCACTDRIKAFKENNLKDMLEYED